MGSSDRREYLTATVLDQDFLDRQHDGLENRLELVAEIETPVGDATPAGMIYASDRNKYVGTVFYEALTNFPTVRRTVGDYLNPTLQFSNISLPISNVDGRYNDILPGGANYAGWIGKEVEIKLGLAEASATYSTIFKGKISDVGGFQRNTDTIILTARDENDQSNKTFPTVTFNLTTYPKLSNDDVGKGVPTIYGDWTVNLDPFAAIVPATIVNSADPFIQITETQEVTFDDSTDTATAVDHRLDDDDFIEFATSGTLPSPLAAATGYYVISATANTFQVSNSMGGAAINLTTAGSGDHTLQPEAGEAYEDLSCVVSSHDISQLNDTDIFLRRGSNFYTAPSADVTIGSGNRSFTLDQDTANLWVEGAAYTYESSDEFYVKCKGKALVGGTYDDNAVEQARDILITYGGRVSGDFDANWDTYRAKATPAQSAIVDIKSRAWIQENNDSLTYALSLLEQVRLEAFIERSANKFKILSMHNEDWDPAPTYQVKNWDVAEKSFKPKIDDRSAMIFNRTQAAYSYFPIRGQESRTTSFYKNAAAITQHGKEITKSIIYPNLYISTDVVNQLTETLKITSATIETIECELTWRSMLTDISDFVKIDVKIGASIFTDVPAMVRSIGYNPKGMGIPVTLLSMQMVPFESWDPTGEGYGGVVGGGTATITEDI